jgi:deoxyribodipyrimidine photo-lyase
MSAIIVWFRKDLRLIDNPALSFAARRLKPILPLYIYEDLSEKDWPIGEAQKWWLYHSLKAFKEKLDKLNLSLIIRKGHALEIINNFVQDYSIEEVYWNRRYEPAEIKRDQAIKSALKERGITTKSFNGSLLFEPEDVKNNQKDYFKVFSAYWKNCLLFHKPRDIMPASSSAIPLARDVKSDSVESLRLLPDLEWAEGFHEIWCPGEDGAQKRFKSFLNNRVLRYRSQRDFPGIEGTSKLSPHLHFGEISPHFIWHHIQKTYGGLSRYAEDSHIETFLKELGWREFCAYLLYHYPELPLKNFQRKFDNLQWSADMGHLSKWQRGLTGYPIVDAGMRQLWHWGWMHNRVRMIVASFLTKNLQLDWRKGQRWFWDTLLDADMANNAGGWQWVAGSGADAAPYFRVFNPVLQGEKFDPEGSYIKKWVPELQALPLKYIHQPWMAPKEILTNANVILGDNYPSRIIDHNETRKSTLEAYRCLSS